MKNILAVVVILGASIGQLQAGGTRGGGNAVVCFAKHPEVIEKYKNEMRDAQTGELQNVLLEAEDIELATSIEPLDLYQARGWVRGAPQNREIIESLDGESVEEYIERIFSRFSFYYPELHKQLVSAQRQIPLKEAWHEGFGLRPEQDFSVVGQIDTSKCLLTSLMVQETIGAAVNLHIDNRLWTHKALSSLEKGVMYLHEIVHFYLRHKYRQELKRGKQLRLADIARRVVLYLITYEAQRTYEDFFLKLDSLGFASFPSGRDQPGTRLVDELSVQLLDIYFDTRREYIEPRIDELFEIFGEPFKEPSEMNIFIRDGWGQDEFVRAYQAYQKEDYLEAANHLAALNHPFFRIEIGHGWTERGWMGGRYALLKEVEPETYQRMMQLIGELSYAAEVNKRPDRFYYPYWDAIRGQVFQAYVEELEPQVSDAEQRWLSASESALVRNFFREHIQNGAVPMVPIAGVMSEDGRVLSYVDRLSASRDRWRQMDFIGHSVFIWSRRSSEDSAWEGFSDAYYSLRAPMELGYNEKMPMPQKK